MITQMETKKDGAGNVITEQKYNHLAAAEMMSEDNTIKLMALSTQDKVLRNA